LEGMRIRLPRWGETPRTATDPLDGLVCGEKPAVCARTLREVGGDGKLVWVGMSCDHQVQHERESVRIRNYVEENPVRARERGMNGVYPAGLNDLPDGGWGVYRRPDKSTRRQRDQVESGPQTQARLAGPNRP
jgi:hypothetical protein